MSKRRCEVLGSLLLAAASLALAPRAHACSCPSHSAWVAWPVADARDVPTDTTLIVQASVGADVRLTLRDPQGQVVDLLAVRTLDASPGCGVGREDVVFFAPVKPLAPGVRYQATMSFDPPADLGGKVITPVAFTTGAGPRQASPVPATERHLMAQLLADGSRILQLFATNPATEPVFMLTRGQPSTSVHGLGALELVHPTGVALGKAPCADVEFVDVTGATILRDMMCEPEKCTRSEIVAGDDCGGNLGGEPWSVWQTRPLGCGADGNAPGGCAVSPAHGHRGPVAVATATLPLLLWARRRRRARR
jgi:hypothetical protein